MIFKIAYMNFVSRGMRAFLNSLVTALTIVVIIFNISLYNGFQNQATRNMVRTDVAGGHYRVPEFDILTPTDWEDRTMQIPNSLKKLSPSDKAEILIQQGQIYPNRRLFPVQMRGINMEQTLLDIPLHELKNWQSGLEDVVPAVLGSKMADKAHLKKGDLVVMKWRDKFGAVDARDIQIVDVVTIINPRIDEGLIWLRLDHLRELTQRPGEVTWVAVKGYSGPAEGMEFFSIEKLMEDILNIIKNDRRFARILWGILIFLAGISIFNTQILSVFKRQKEIGTLMAFGMTSRQIVTLFTLEGSLSAFISVFLAFLLGIPFFAWFQSVGLDVSHLQESSLPIRENIICEFYLEEIINTIVVVVLIMVFVAWAPVRKISQLDPTLALRGRGIT